MTYKQEIKDKLDAIKETVRERSKEHEGLGEEIEKVHSGGPYLRPRNEQEYEKLVKEIEDAGKEFKEGEDIGHA